MLTFIGLGLWDEKDITVRGLEAVKAADAVYAEFYTSRLFGTTLEDMEKLYNKKIIIMDRASVEQNPEETILKEAKTKKVALLVGGDALTATTHSDLWLRARKLGIEVKVVHNASIYTAAPALAGLQAYKFGRSATVTYWEKNFEPTSFYEVIAENKARGLHTLLFLDIKADRNMYMSPNEAIEVLEKCEKEKGAGLMTEKTKLVVVSRAGSDKTGVAYDTIGHLKDMEFGGPLHIMIYPGELHFVEEEFLGKC